MSLYRNAVWFLNGINHYTRSVHHWVLTLIVCRCKLKQANKQTKSECILCYQNVNILSTQNYSLSDELFLCIQGQASGYQISDRHMVPREGCSHNSSIHWWHAMLMMAASPDSTSGVGNVANCESTGLFGLLQKRRINTDCFSSPYARCLGRAMKQHLKALSHRTWMCRWWGGPLWSLVPTVESAEQQPSP